MDSLASFHLRRLGVFCDYPSWGLVHVIVLNVPLVRLRFCGAKSTTAGNLYPSEFKVNRIPSQLVTGFRFLTKLISKQGCSTRRNITETPKGSSI